MTGLSRFVPAAAVAALTVTSALALAPTTGSAAPAAKCKQSHSNIKAVSATNKPSRVVVSGKVAKWVCGGPDDGHYVVTKKPETLRLKKTTTVKILTNKSDGGLGYRRIRPTRLHKYLQHPDAYDDIVTIYGPTTDPTKLVEAYHP